jgi:manganese efflux pump family protein
MVYLEIFLIACGLSFDTFAVSVSTGLTISQIRFWQGVKIAFILAFFQTLMPLIGWMGGIRIEKHFSEYDHWIAFGLLAALGVKMMMNAFKVEEEKKFNPLLTPVVIWMAIATSIDALVVGISLGLLKTNIYISLAVIGSVTFLAAMFGMLLGKNAGGRHGRKIELLGGAILILIGLKILLHHLL